MIYIIEPEEYLDKKLRLSQRSTEFRMLLIYEQRKKFQYVDSSLS